MSVDQRVKLSIEQDLAFITLIRPEARNALDLRAAAELDTALSEAEQNEQVRVMILAAEGPAFCAGADLKALARGEAEGFIEDRGWGGLTLRMRVKPLIAVVEGAALAGGFELVLSADLVVATHDASFGLPEVRWGLIAASGGAARLPRHIAPNLAVELLLTGDEIDAEQAHRLGIVNRLADRGDALAVARELAGRIALNAPLALGATLRVAAASIALGEQAASEIAANELRLLRDTEDVSEGLAAFADKRAPVWKGR